MSYAHCYYCQRWEWSTTTNPSMFCSPVCERAAAEIARLNEEIRRLQNLLAGVR